jgi:hypothetical protein
METGNGGKNVKIKIQTKYMNLNKKYITGILFLMSSYCQLCAQIIAKPVMDKYNYSVVAKVFSIAKHVDINPQLQMQIAESVYLHDSTICNWISIGKSKGSIDTLQQIAQFQVYGMLSREQLQTYKYNSNFEISNAIATGEAAYINEEYKPDSITSKEIKKSLINKYNYLLQSFSDNYIMNQQMAIDYVKKLGSIYDGYKYFPLVYSKKYIADYIGTIKKIKKIPDSAIAKIEHSFYNFIGEDKYTSWSHAAENATRKHMPDTIIFSALHNKEFEQQATEAAITERHSMIFTNHISAAAFEPLTQLIKKKSYVKIVLQNTYASYYPQQYNLLLRQNMKYYDSLAEAILMRDGSLQPTTQFAIALKLKTQLQLRPTLCDTLVQHAMYLATLRDSILLNDPFATIDFGNYEATYLTPLLTEEQYSSVLFQRNRTYARNNALTDWEEMIVRGLDNGFFKDETVKQMTDYYIIKNSAWCRYANDKVKLWANLYTIDQTKPKALKVLDPVRWSGATKKVNNNLQLKW